MFSPTAPALAIRDLWFAYPQQPPVLAGLSLAVPRGQFVALLGPSGLGKSTLFRIVAGLERPGRGTVEPQGAAAYMPQRDCLLPWRTVAGNAALGLEVQGVPPAAARAQVLARLPEFGLAGAADRYPHQLSGGMRQRVALLRTVLQRRELLLLDEPFAALDALTRAGMQQWLLDLWERLRRTVLFITHDVEEALLLADRVLVLTGRPLSAAMDCPVPLPRPRRHGLVTDPGFVVRRARLMALLAPAGEGDG